MTVKISHVDILWGRAATVTVKNAVEDFAKREDIKVSLFDESARQVKASNLGFFAGGNVNIERVEKPNVSSNVIEQLQIELKNKFGLKYDDETIAKVAAGIDSLEKGKQIPSQQKSQEEVLTASRPKFK